MSADLVKALNRFKEHHGGIRLTIETDLAAMETKFIFRERRKQITKTCLDFYNLSALEQIVWFENAKEEALDDFYFDFSDY